MRTSALLGSALAVAFGLASCSGEEAPAAGATSADGVAATGDPSSDEPNGRPEANPYRFERWYADFPVFSNPLHLSPRVGGLVYDRSRRAALDQLVSNLQGNCTRAAWLMVKDFFERMPDEAVPLLIENMDRAFQARDRTEIVENTVIAMGRAADPRFADALLRAIEHPKESVRSAAMRALGTSGTADAVRKAGAAFAHMDLRMQTEWLKAARAHLGDEVVEIYRSLFNEPRYEYLRKQLIEQTRALPPARAREVLEPMWPSAAGSFRLTIAGVLHASGDSRGTLVIREALRDLEPMMRLEGLMELLRGDPAPLIDDVLKLTIDDDARVRAGSISAIAGIPGENVDNTLTTLALDPAPEVRQAALNALSRRGVRGHLDRLIEAVRKSSGNVLRQALEDVVAANDAAAVPAIAERLAAAPPEEKRLFLGALARTRCIEAWPLLREYLLAPEQPFADGGDLTNVTYVGVLLPNVVGVAPPLLAFFDELPRDDYRRRAVVLTSLGNLAATTRGGQTRAAFVSVAGDVAQQIYDRYRKLVLDRAELPQIRLLALEWLRRDLRLDDAFAIKAQLRDEEPAMRAALTDFLFEFF